MFKIEIMGMQTTMFEKPNEDPAKISSLIRSESSHELGLTLAKANNYNHVELLIDLIYYNFHLIGGGCCENFDYRYYQLFLFKIETTDCLLSELNAESFYLELHHGEDIKVDLEIYEWKESDKWGDFDLAKLAEKEIRKNRQYIDAVLKNKA